jgi:hypothetical protein
MVYFQWDPGIIYKSAPLILEGGYEEWLLKYPMLTTNPHVKSPHNCGLSEMDDLLGNLDKTQLKGKLVLDMQGLEE